MSKTLAQLAQYLSASNEQLYDRYINFRLTRVEPGTPGVSTAIANSRALKRIASIAKGGTSKAVSSEIEAINTELDDDFIVRCPLTGIKPSITVSASFHVQNTSNLITLTVVNMNANIDTMAYNWAEIEVGYLKSGVHTRFAGQITNCYMAKPNPNGELVVSVVCANIASMYTQGAFEVQFTDDFVATGKLVETCVRAIVAEYPELKTDLEYSTTAAGLPAEWAVQSFLVNKATYRFRSPLECITWLNSLFASYVYNTGFARGAGGGVIASMDVAETKLKLPPLRLGFDKEGRLVYTSTMSEPSPGTVKALSCIGSAFLTGTSSATVTAPFNPDIAPGEVIYIDTKYFKTRVNMEAVRQAYASMGNLWYIIEMQFTFSTLTTNTMTLLLNNIANKVEAGEG